MRKQLIESYINRLRASFGPMRAPVKEEQLKTLHDAKDYAGMLLHVQSSLQLDMKLFIGLVNKGGPPAAPAWAEVPTVMPLIGTPAFRQSSVTVYLRKTFLAEATFETVVMAVAHELSHVVLNSTWHSLRKEEEAVDLTAMLFGFRDFYVTGCRSNGTIEMRAPTDTENGYIKVSANHYGYLSREEVGYAAEYMTYS